MQALPKPQLETAESYGMSRRQVFRRCHPLVDLSRLCDDEIGKVDWRR